jgi:hypothetical protein
VSPHRLRSRRLGHRGCQPAGFVAGVGGQATVVWHDRLRGRSETSRDRDATPASRQILSDVAGWAEAARRRTRPSAHADPTGGRRTLRRRLTPPHGIGCPVTDLRLPGMFARCVLTHCPTSPGLSASRPSVLRRRPTSPHGYPPQSYHPGSAPFCGSRPCPLRAAARRDAGLSRDIARLRASLRAGRSDLCRSALRAPSTEKTRPAPIVELARPRPRRQHARYQQPFEVLEPQACFARAMVDFDPRGAPPPEIRSQHDCLHVTTTSALSRCRRENGTGAERAV